MSVTLHPINRRYFFDRVRHALFGGRLEMWQVDGLTRILDYRDTAWPNMPSYFLWRTGCNTAFSLSHPVRSLR